MADIFQEVEEELKKDEYLKLWQRYGRYVIAVAVAAVLGTAGVMGWQQYQTSQRMAEADSYQAALRLAQEGKAEDAIAAFAELSGAGSGYAALAGFQEGALKARSGDKAGAVAAYDRVAGDQNIDQELRNLATLLAVLHGLDSAEPSEIVARLQPLTADDSPWRHSALELTALASLRAGQTAEARTIFTRLTDDQTAPAGVRGRAAELLSVLGQ
ncbi:MAG: tetratricopeptide repeat protein [Alphaproteobacteria bacterium]|nr:tetratricopeptide repeat protein [Alphaproteobacteria bacterium]